jgi:hypothetical protein
MDPENDDELPDVSLRHLTLLRPPQEPLAGPGQDRRSQDERRSRPTRGWDSFFHRRRHIGRREGENQDIYVDVFRKRDVALLLGIFILNILDAFFTLLWLQMGGGEGNPLMEQLLKTSDLLFLFQKCVVVGLWLLILMAHKNFRAARIGLWGAFVLYACVLVYHFVLQSMGPPPLPPSAGPLSLH